MHKGTTLMQIVPLCYLHLVAAYQFYTCAQDGLDTVQLVLVVFSFHQLAQILHLHLWWSSLTATCSVTHVLLLNLSIHAK